MTTRLLRKAVIVAIATSAACDFNIANPNSPDPLGNDPSPNEVASAVTGLLIGSRAYAADWIIDIGIIGRESYRFDGSDPRFTGELLTGPLDAGSGAFGGDHWFEMYRNIRTANNLLNVINTATRLTPAEQSGVQGVAQTMQALDFLYIVNARSQDSIPIAVNTPPTGAPAPFATRAEALDHIGRLLDSAQTALQNAGATFAFELSSGFDGFSDPATFLLFNRALRARLAIYRGDGTAALAAVQTSFVDTLQPLDRGAYHVFSIGAGDVTNPLNRNAVENFVHPQVRDSAQLQVGGQPDRRFLAKTFTTRVGTEGGLTSDIGWARYASAQSPIPIIRNEELILIRAEANILLNDLTSALADINFVRVNSGGLAPLGAFADQAAATNALLLERRYSLLWEGGHRWIDMKRYGRLGQIAVDRSGDVVHPTFPIPRDEVLARQ
jgi:hypothetical protein